MSEVLDAMIAGHVLETSATFRRPLLQTADKETLFVGMATLMSDLASHVAKDETPEKAVQMLLTQIDILFEENPGLKARILAAQLRQFMDGKH